MLLSSLYSCTVYNGNVYVYFHFSTVVLWSYMKFHVPFICDIDLSYY